MKASNLYLRKLISEQLNAALVEKKFPPNKIQISNDEDCSSALQQCYWRTNSPSLESEDEKYFLQMAKGAEKLAQELVPDLYVVLEMLKKNKLRWHQGSLSSLDAWNFLWDVAADQPEVDLLQKTAKKDKTMPPIVGDEDAAQAGGLGAKHPIRISIRWHINRRNEFVEKWANHMKKNREKIEPIIFVMSTIELASTLVHELAHLADEQDPTNKELYVGIPEPDEASTPQHEIEAAETRAYKQQSDFFLAVLNSGLLTSKVLQALLKERAIESLDEYDEEYYRKND